MGKASSAKKVARAARAGGSRRAGQRRQLGFPVAIGLVLVFGLALVLIARERRNADAFPRANQDHVHASIDIYTCVTAEEAAAAASTTTTSSTTTTTTTTTPPSTSSGETTTTSTTTTTVPTTSTTQLTSTDVHGEYQAAPTDASQDVLGIHTHGDGLMHIHPFKDSVAGRNATLGVFLDQVGISMTNNALSLPGGKSFTEGTTKCEDGKDGVLQVAKWDHVDEAARGNKPNQIFTDGFDKIRLGANESFVIAFMPEGSTIKAQSDVQDRINKVSDLAPSTTAAGSNSPSTVVSVPASGAPASGAPSANASVSSDQGSSTTAPSNSTATTTPASSSSSSP